MWIYILYIFFFILFIYILYINNIYIIYNIYILLLSYQFKFTSPILLTKTIHPKRYSQEPELSFTLILFYLYILFLNIKDKTDRSLCQHYQGLAQAKARNQDLNVVSQVCGRNQLWAILRHLTEHFNRKLQLEVEPALKPTHSDTQQTKLPRSTLTIVPTTCPIQIFEQLCLVSFMNQEPFSIFATFQHFKSLLFQIAF